MLTFVDMARRDGFVVDAYEDEAVGTMERIAPGRMAITKVILRPRIAYSGEAPDKAQRDDLHHRAHEACFIANSVTTAITIEDTTA
jgi:organic hydroperoxide reductase OsmC/OhrA